MYFRKSQIEMIKNQDWDWLSDREHIYTPHSLFLVFEMLSDLWVKLASDSACHFWGDQDPSFAYWLPLPNLDLRGGLLYFGFSVVQMIFYIVRGVCVYLRFFKNVLLILILFWILHLESFNSRSKYLISLACFWWIRGIFKSTWKEFSMYRNTFFDEWLLYEF